MTKPPSPDKRNLDDAVLTFHSDSNITATLGGEDVDAMDLLQEILTSDLEKPDS